MQSTDASPEDLAKDTRGSATTEGVIVAPVLVLLFAAVLWAGARYATERRNAALAHDQPWAQALAGCVDGAPDPEIAEALGAYRGRLSTEIPRLRPDLDRVVVTRVDGSRTAAVSRPAPLGGGALELHEETRTSCNTIGVHWSEDEIEAMTLDEFCRLTPYCDPP
jgi:hypothetical protein